MVITTLLAYGNYDMVTEGNCDYRVLTQIPVVADLPVGDNLHDHVFFSYSVGVKEPVGVAPEDLTSFWTWLQYTLFKTGT